MSISSLAVRIRGFVDVNILERIDRCESRAHIPVSPLDQSRSVRTFSVFHRQRIPLAICTPTPAPLPHFFPVTHKCHCRLNSHFSPPRCSWSGSQVVPSLRWGESAMTSELNCNKNNISSLKRKTGFVYCKANDVSNVCTVPDNCPDCRKFADEGVFKKTLHRAESRYLPNFFGLSTSRHSTENCGVKIIRKSTIRHLIISKNKV